MMAWVRKLFVRLGLRGHHPHPPAPSPASGRGEKRARCALGRAGWTQPFQVLLTNGLRRVAVGDESVEEGGCHQGCYDCHDHETGEEFFADDPSF